MHSVRTGLIIICICFLAMGNTVSAQCCGSSYAANEIGARVGSLTNASRLGGIYVPEQDMRFAVFNGIHYKRYFYSSAIRLIGSYTSYQMQDRPVCVDCFTEISGKIKAGEVRVGWEYIFIMNHFEPYIGIDIVGTVGVFDGIEEGTGINTLEIEDHRRRTSVGLSPVLGFRIFPVNLLSISMETSIVGFFHRKQIRRTEKFPENELTYREAQGLGWQYHPISNLSVNVLF